MTPYKVVFRRNTHDLEGNCKSIILEQEQALREGCSGLTLHLGSSDAYMTLSDIYLEHVSYAAQHHEECPSICEVMQALIGLVESDLYTAEVIRIISDWDRIMNK